MNVLFSIGHVTDNDTMRGIHETISNFNVSLLDKTGKQFVVYDVDSESRTAARNSFFKGSIKARQHGVSRKQTPCCQEKPKTVIGKHRGIRLCLSNIYLQIEEQPISHLTSMKFR